MKCDVLDRTNAEQCWLRSLLGSTNWGQTYTRKQDSPNAPPQNREQRKTHALIGTLFQLPAQPPKAQPRKGNTYCKPHARLAKDELSLHAQSLGKDSLTPAKNPCGMNSQQQDHDTRWRFYSALDDLRGLFLLSLFEP